MPMAADPFDFAKADVPVEDVVVRTYEPGTERWIDTLLAASGRKALWNVSPGWTAPRKSRQSNGL